MADKRNWFQRFLDQCSFGPEYTLQLTPEQANKALDELGSYTKKGWRTKGIIEKLQRGVYYPTIVGQQKVITITLDTSDTICLKDILNLTRESVQCVTTDDGFSKTTQKFGLRE